MQVKELKHEGLNYELEVIVSAGDIDKEIEKKLQQYGKTIAEQNSFGLTDAVQREMMRHQEAQSHDTK